MCVNELLRQAVVPMGILASWCHEETRELTTETRERVQLSFAVG